ncbi:MAG TPA: ribokinase [Candidatus Limnocylindria bacterium]|jgi:ribokinase|nr:ribokinase [Candidatus Limnocylindria bacterium]
MNGRITVIGSINVDLVVRADRLPQPGETILGGRFTQFHGGKGANQAVAAARAGGQVTMIGAVGDDAYGLMAVQALSDEGIDVSRVRTVDAPTGVALIGVGARGENMILVAPGANAELIEDDLDLADAAVLLTNFEIPLTIALAAVRAARASEAIPVVTPAPAHALSADLLDLAPILVPNEHELTVMIGNDDPAAALAEVTAATSGAVVVTQGPAGALLGRGDERRRFDSPRPVADPVDTTGAGDAFVGAMATWLASGHSLEEAIGAGNAAGALSVMAAGARAGLPDRRAIDELLAG